MASNATFMTLLRSSRFYAMQWDLGDSWDGLRVQRYSLMMNNSDNSKDHPLVERFTEWGAELEREYKSSKSKGGSPDDVADFRELSLRRFLETYFPFPFIVTKGTILDVKGNRSGSVDNIILSPIHPRTMGRSGGKAEIILADGVEVAIEVKSDPHSNSEMDRLVKQSRKAKKLQRINDNMLLPKRMASEKGRERVQAESELNRKIPYFAFFMDSTDRFSDAANQMASKMWALPALERPDFIIINKTGIITNNVLSDRFGYKTPGIYFEKWSDYTMAGFLLYLNLIPTADISLKERFLVKYIEPLWKEIPRTQFLPGTDVATIEKR